jgi:hypothetical protein
VRAFEPISSPGISCALISVVITCCHDNDKKQYGEISCSENVSGKQLIIFSNHEGEELFLRLVLFPQHTLL